MTPDDAILLGIVLLVVLVTWLIVRRLVRRAGRPDPAPFRDDAPDMVVPRVVQAPRREVAQHPPRAPTVEAQPRAEATIDRYFRLTDLVTTARATGQHAEAIALAKGVWPLIPGILQGEFAGVNPQEIPAIDLVLEPLVAAGDEASLTELRDVVTKSPRLATLRLSAVEAALGGLGLSLRILDAVAQQPGVVQKDLDEMLGVEPEAVRERCYWMAHLGRLERTKKRSSYALFPPSRPAPPVQIGADGLPVVRRICPACHKEIHGTPEGCRWCGRDLRSVWPSGRESSESDTGDPHVDYPGEVVGESFRQDALDAIVDSADDDGRERADESAACRTTARLVLEDDNRHDDQAVKVTIQGRHVGYLSRADARRYRRMPNAPGEVPALIVGGWDRGPGDVGHYGVRLRLELPD